MSLGVEDKLADDELLLLGNVLEFSGKTVGAIMVGVDLTASCNAANCQHDERAVDHRHL